MTQEEYYSIDWQYGNVVMLDNGKEYKVIKQKKGYLLLYTEEYDKLFVVDSKIILKRTSDRTEPFPEKKDTEEKLAAPKAADKPKKAEPKAAKAEKEEPKGPKVEKVNIALKYYESKGKAEDSKPTECPKPIASTAPEKPKRKRIMIIKSTINKFKGDN